MGCIYKYKPNTKEEQVFKTDEDLHKFLHETFVPKGETQGKQTEVTGTAFHANTGEGNNSAIFLTTEESANAFAPEGNIEQYNYTLKNPLVIKNDSDFDVVKKIIDDFQTTNPDAKFHPDVTTHVNKELEKLGYDGMIIEKSALETEKGYNEIGSTYGDAQIVLFDRKNAVKSSEQQPKGKQEEVTNDALKDVESTAKALDEVVDSAFIGNTANLISDKNWIDGKTSEENIAEQYHADKAAGKETELIKAVEEALGKKSAPTEVKTEPINKVSAPENKIEQPPIAPEGKVKQEDVVPEPEMTGITHEQTDAVAKSFGLPTYQEKPETVAEWDAEADKRIAEDTHVVGKILDSMREGNTPKDPVEQRILIKYAADLQAKIEKNPADTKLLNDYQDFKKVSDVMGGQLVGKLLKARDGKVPVTESLADMLLSEKESTKVDSLTEGQVKKQTDLFAKIKKAKDDAEAKLKEAESEIARLKAEKEFKKQKTANIPNAKKTHTDFINERKDLLNQWKELSNKKPDEPTQSGIPLTDKHIKIIGKFVKSYAEEGLTNLKDIVGNIAVALGLEEKDVHDVIAGKYNEPLPPKTEVQKNIADLKYEAKFINELDSLMKNGIPKTEAKRIERNKKIKDLQDKIKDFKKDNPNLENEIQKVRDRNLSAAKKWKEKLDKGEFTTKKKEGFEDKFAELKQSNPKLWNETMDAIIKKEDAQNEFYIGQKQNELNNRKFNQKVRDAGLSANATLRAVLTGIDDSAVFVQNIVALIAHPKTAVKALPEHLKDAFSEKRFNRQLAALHNSPMYWLMQKSGLSITEPKALRGNQHEEIFDKNLLNKSFKVYGREYNISKYTTKPFERMFTSLGNNTRANAFLRMAEKLYSTGHTWENDPESFTSLAKVLNNETGRPALPEAVERASGLLTAVLWSPRLLTSSLNILGISDAASLVTGNKGYYRALTPRMKLYAIADFAKFAAAVLAVGAVFALQGWDFDINPLSTKFGTISRGGKSYNIFGRFSGVIKLSAQMSIGKRVIDGLYEDLSPKQRFLDAPTHFLRGKTTPLLGAGISAIEGKDYTGHPTDWKEQGLGLLSPLSIKGIADGVKNEGISSIFTTGVPSFGGINVSYEGDFKKQMPDTIKHNGEDVKLTDEQQQQFQNSYDTHEQDYLNALVNTEKYKNSDDAEKLRLQQMVSYWAHTKSEKELKESYPQEFGELTSEEYEKQQQEVYEMEQLKENIGLK